jgi:glyoxylase-like metal-dependent hydrolase (beta-lactamase superfamily II)
MSEIPDMSTFSDAFCCRGAGAATVLVVHFAWEQLTAGVHRCRLPFCDVTIGLVLGRTGTLLVDTGTTLVEAAAIDADVRRIAGRPVTHVVLTHKHFDHVLGSSAFADAADPAIDADSDVAAWPATLDRVLAIGGPQAVYVPGHGKTVDAEFIRRQRDWLSARGRRRSGRPGRWN